MKSTYALAEDGTWIVDNVSSTCQNLRGEVVGVEDVLVVEQVSPSHENLRVDLLQKSHERETSRLECC